MLSVCIVIVTLNTSRTLLRCLETIFDQDYPKIEVIIVDGGSTDKTISIAKKYKVKVITRRGLDSESSKAVGLLAAKADIYCDMAADNYLPSRHFISDLMTPINQNKADASYPEKYFYDKKDNSLNRYFALFGVNDPVAYYLKKADRSPYFNQEKNYTDLPTVGANGFFIAKKWLLKYADLKNFYHIDVIKDILDKYPKLRIAIVNDAIGHDSGENITSYLKKRRNYFKNLYLDKIQKRRYHLYDQKKDKTKLVKFIIYSLTFIQPLYLSIKGFIKIHDIAWFLHPVICFLTICNYGISYYRYKK